ncbi:MAG: tetratricopeptide repeat protein [Candidatus Gastranaerophilales bacterium]
MKKILLTLLILNIFTMTTASAVGIANPFKKEEKNKPEPVKVSLENENTTKQAMIYYVDNDLENSLKLFLTVPEEERTSMNWFFIGNILQDQGKNSEAIFMYKNAIALDEKNYKAHYNLANMYLDDEKANMAVAEYKKVIEIKPDNPYVHYNLGCAYVKLGELRKAKNSFIYAIDLKNTEADFHYNLAYVYKKLKNEKKAQLYLGYYNQILEQQLD